MMGVWVEDRRWKGIEFLFLSFYHRTYPINNFFLESISLSLTVTNTFSSVMMTWCILIIDFSNLWNILGWLNKLIFSKLKFIFFLTSLLRGKRGGEGEHGRRGCERERRRPEGDWPSARRWNHSNRNDYLCRLSGAVWSFSFFFFFPIAWYSTQQTPTLPTEPPPPSPACDRGDGVENHFLPWLVRLAFSPRNSFISTVVLCTRCSFFLSFFLIPSWRFQECPLWLPHGIGQ